MTKMFGLAAAGEVESAALTAAKEQMRRPSQRIQAKRMQIVLMICRDGLCMIPKIWRPMIFISQQDVEKQGRSQSVGNGLREGLKPEDGREAVQKSQKLRGNF